MVTQMPLAVSACQNLFISYLCSCGPSFNFLGRFWLYILSSLYSVSHNLWSLQFQVLLCPAPLIFYTHVKMELHLPLSESDKYSNGVWNLDREREGSPSINLCLGIGAGPGRSIDERRPIFTAQQLHELNHQALIFKYIIAGLSVPVHLIVPIWKSVSCSFGSPYLGICNQCPSSLGFNHQHFNQRTAMDPEPGRCRRTDGKRWRCSKNAVDGQKYCERHMNRGNSRSRKHVEEASRNILESHKSTATTTTTTNTEINDSYSKWVNVGTETNAKTVIMDQRTGRNNSNYIKENEAGFKCADSVNISSYGSYDGGKSKFARFSATIQGATGGNGNSSSSESRTLVDIESKRCKRTDGKKWRCRHEVVAEQKYCARHIHRGVRKTKLPSETVTVAAPPPPVVMHENVAINLNTRLSISVPETCSNEGSSSDATTITDDNTSFTRVSVMFPQ